MAFGGVFMQDDREEEDSNFVALEFIQFANAIF